MPKGVPPVERICGAMCRYHGIPENAAFEGRPLWESYRGQARHMLRAFREGDQISDELVVTRRIVLH